MDRIHFRRAIPKSAPSIPIKFWWIIAVVLLSARFGNAGQSDFYPAIPIVPNHQTIEREIKQLISDEYTHWNLQDIEGYMSYFWRSPLFSWEVDGEFTIGWEACREQLYQEYPDSSAMGKVTDDRIQINLIAPDLATVVDWWTINVRGKRISGFTVSTVKKFSEGWRLMKTFTSTSINPAFER